MDKDTTKCRSFTLCTKWLTEEDERENLREELRVDPLRERSGTDERKVRVRDGDTLIKRKKSAAAVC